MFFVNFVFLSASFTPTKTSSNEENKITVSQISENLIERHSSITPTDSIAQNEIIDTIEYHRNQFASYLRNHIQQTRAFWINDLMKKKESFIKAVDDFLKKNSYDRYLRISNIISEYETRTNKHLPGKLMRHIRKVLRYDYSEIDFIRRREEPFEKIEKKFINSILIGDFYHEKIIIYNVYRDQNRRRKTQKKMAKIFRYNPSYSNFHLLDSIQEAIKLNSYEKEEMINNLIHNMNICCEKLVHDIDIEMYKNIYKEIEKCKNKIQSELTEKIQVLIFQNVLDEHENVSAYAN